MRAFLVVGTTVVGVMCTFRALHRIIVRQDSAPKAFRPDIAIDGLLVLATATAILGIYALAAIRSRLAVDPPDRRLLYRFPIPLLVAITIVAAGALLVQIRPRIHAEYWTRRSIATSLTMNYTLGIVESSGDDAVVIDVPESSTLPVLTDTGYAPLGDGLTDRSGRPIEKATCTGSNDSCFTFHSNWRVEPGTETYVWSDDHLHLAVLEPDRWPKAGERDLSAFILIVLGLVTLMTRSVSTILHKRAAARLGLRGQTRSATVPVGVAP